MARAARCLARVQPYPPRGGMSCARPRPTRRERAGAQLTLNHLHKRNKTPFELYGQLNLQNLDEIPVLERKNGMFYRTLLWDFLMYTIYNDINAFVDLRSACSTRI